MRIVDPQMAMALLHRKAEQIPPIMPSNTGPMQIQPNVNFLNDLQLLKFALFFKKLDFRSQNFEKKLNNFNSVKVGE